LADVRALTYKPRDAWWTVLLVDPLASRLVLWAARFRWITPNRLTMVAFVLGAGAAACFAGQTHGWLIAGAALFHLSFVVDCMDGKVARLVGSGSIFGGWLDYVFDRLRVLVCAGALMIGQYAHTQDLTYLGLGAAVVFLDMFRYLNALQMAKMRSQMRSTYAAALGDDGPRPVFVEDVVQQHPIGAAEGVVTFDKRPVVDVNNDFRSRFGLFVRFRNYLVRHRIRAHVVSGVEFQMAVFIVGPVTLLIIDVTIVAGTLLLAFETLLVLKLWMATSTFSRELAKVATVPAQRSVLVVDDAQPRMMA
jgi:phosphatidylglycerophosphate synthase